MIHETIIPFSIVPTFLIERLKIVTKDFLFMICYYYIINVVVVVGAASAGLTADRHCIIHA
jgi:hypothetical protein